MLVINNPLAGSAELEYVNKALVDGELVVVPTDTIYGIAALAASEAAVERLYACKGRPASQPTAVMYATVAQLCDELDWLDQRAAFAVQALLPGPWTLIVDNPRGHLPWLTGGEAGPLAVRVPVGALDLPPIAATSANLAGEPTIESPRELAPELLDEISCAVDRGVLPRGYDSTILDLVAWSRDEGEIRVLRDPASRAGVALAALVDAPR